MVRYNSSAGHIIMLLNGQPQHVLACCPRLALHAQQHHNGHGMARNKAVGKAAHPEPNVASAVPCGLTLTLVHTNATSTTNSTTARAAMQPPMITVAPPCELSHDWLLSLASSQSTAACRTVQPAVGKLRMQAWLRRLSTFACLPACCFAWARNVYRHAYNLNASVLTISWKTAIFTHGRHLFLADAHLPRAGRNGPAARQCSFYT